MCVSKTSEENFHLFLDDYELAYKEFHLLPVKCSFTFHKTFPPFLTFNCSFESISEVVKPEHNIH